MSVFPKNTVLTFTEKTPSANLDKFGNRIIVDTDLVLEASLKVDSTNQNKVLTGQGDDPNIIYFEGYCVKPKRLPASVRPNSKAKCTVTDLDSGVTQTGTFTVTMITQSRWKQIPKALGSKFEGYLLYA
jgi:hypothetical protein